MFYTHKNIRVTTIYSHPLTIVCVFYAIVVPFLYPQKK
nr:MAG TPA: hypothetical protein [Caudoviricetes sp.]